ncbi:hypothetical protein [Bartonella apis]|uniref:Uncharacterized protein n=1 Tax=Bartonella apis TaxID=1686310 RepID=A0A1R0FAJ1_9HYPH|nr:hypothetical protein [Bartonella apis]MCT6825374.1 hypothetical protein [Bartonella apis]MCT6861189.1 hypothetical protein [Bartonella apis]MCT6887753.1 hypothetical protein [Bartonella apis]OLY43980.1 hypothetical protein PEB0149_014220 [Bartonella apis]
MELLRPLVIVYGLNAVHLKSSESSVVRYESLCKPRKLICPPLLENTILSDTGKEKAIANCQPDPVNACHKVSVAEMIGIGRNKISRRIEYRWHGYGGRTDIR